MWQNQTQHSLTWSEVTVQQISVCTVWPWLSNHCAVLSRTLCSSYWSSPTGFLFPLSCLKWKFYPLISKGDVQWDFFFKESKSFLYIPGIKMSPVIFWKSWNLDCLPSESPGCTCKLQVSGTGQLIQIFWIGDLGICIPKFCPLKPYSKIQAGCPVDVYEDPQGSFVTGT